MNDGYFRNYRGDLYIGVRLDPDDEELSKEEFDALLEDIRVRDRVRELEQYLASTNWQVIRWIERGIAVDETIARNRERAWREIDELRTLYGLDRPTYIYPGDNVPEAPVDPA